MTNSPDETRTARAAREVRSWMTRRDIRQKDAADLIGQTQQGFSRRLSGQTPFALDELDTLALAFRIRLSVLLGLDTPSETEMDDNQPISDIAAHAPIRKRRGSRSTAYKGAASRHLRNRGLTSGYARVHSLTSGEVAHTRRAA